MTKLWEKGYKLDTLIEQFTVGSDYILDKNLVIYDCLGSIAHAHMLHKIGIVNSSEFEALRQELIAIINDYDSGTFQITLEHEDVHTAVENRLTHALGDVGKKIHTCRSRNDQILVDLRMYMRDQIVEIVGYLIDLCLNLVERAQKHEFTPLVGRTHFQKAMPSSVGVLFGAYSESLLDDVELLKSAYDLINQSPLGSGASYGLTLQIDREMTAHLLGFDRVQNNVLYANNSRGKMESIVMHALMQVMNDLSKIATDLILFSTPEFNYFTIPAALSSGSSLMPQKKNPCGLELIRAKSATMLGNLIQVLTTIRALPSGYNRDFQETKKPLMESCDLVALSVQVCSSSIKQIQINEQACRNAFSPEVYATDYALRATQQGMPFRDIYKKVASEINKLKLEDPVENLKSKQHVGAPGNLGLKQNQKQIKMNAQWAQERHQFLDVIYKKLLTK